MFEDMYPGDESEEQILATDPNDFDVDPSMFYETLQERLGVAYDEDNDDFGGYGGTVAQTITFLAARWDGKTGA
jgi:CBS domain containing-hemolysin-like protein